MKRIVTGLALSFFALPSVTAAPIAAHAKGTAETIPLYGRTLGFTLPADMVRERQG